MFDRLHELAERNTILNTGLIPMVIGSQIKGGTPEYALYGFAVYYASCLVVNWWYYARKDAEIPC